MDKILIKNLIVKGQLGPNHWDAPKAQMLIVNITGFIDFLESDDINDTVSYSTISHHVQAFLETQTDLISLESVAAKVALDCLQFGLKKVEVKIEKTHALLFCDTVGIEITRTTNDLDFLKSSLDFQTIPSKTIYNDNLNDMIFIKNLALPCLIGVNTCERIAKQKVILNLLIHYSPSSNLNYSNCINYHHICKLTSDFVDASSYETIEKMAMDLSTLLFKECQMDKLTLKIEKPSALIFAECSGVEITRSRDVPKSIKDDSKVVAYLSFGTNLGNRLGNIMAALDKLKQIGVSILDTSYLYESTPMYVTDQPRFLNGAFKIETTLNPWELLKELKRIEAELGRNFSTIRNGPRVIDLDILYYDDIHLDSEDLSIPHRAIAERIFVLKPLLDLAPGHVNSRTYRTTTQMLDFLLASKDPQDPFYKVFPIRNELWDFSSKTVIMGILNVTPDSFSDGGLSNTLDDAVANALRMIKDGADIIDIGGQSTAPNAQEIDTAEEIKRVIPVIKAIRDKGIDIPISVDTFRAAVAKAAIEAGADLINDVSGGSRDPDMLNVMAVTHAPVCLMHMRGDSKTMNSLTKYDGDLLVSIRDELTTSVEKAIRQGIYRWNIILDPGIGFAKDSHQCFEIIRRLNFLTDKSSKILRNLPILVGLSRKRFIGHVTNQSVPSNRIWGTAAANTLAIANGAVVIRVHDVKEMKDVVLITDECVRKPSILSD
ncbi:Dihydropteroate synthase-like protein [Globomyces pollinis-pini]|nr:Dihydropteroate synthase-like protein [Globomyces pollinis-pini]